MKNYPQKSETVNNEKLRHGFETSLSSNFLVMRFGTFDKIDDLKAV